MASIFRSELFTGRVALITGGGTGIGLATAQELGRLGASIAICGRRPEPLQAAAKELAAEGVEVVHGTCDIREPETIDTFLDGVLERFGPIEILVNNAGGQFPTPAAACSPRGFAAVVRNNLLGTWNMTHAVANRCLIPASGGCIVNVTALVVRGFPGMVHTGAARAGVENLTKTLAVEWAAFGIRVNAVAPGVIRSTGTSQYPKELLIAARKAIPQKRLGRPDEIASMITYLASPAAEFLTGQTLIVDGGQSLWGDVWQLPETPPTAIVLPEEEG